MATWVVKTADDYKKAAKAIQRKLDKISKALLNAPRQAIADIALDCLSRAVQRAPVELGDLRASGFVEINDMVFYKGTKDGSIEIKQQVSDSDGRAASVVAKIGFTAKYAWVQHEHVEFNHPEGGQAKYLESVIVESSARWKAHIKQKIMDAEKEAAHE